MHSSFAPTGCWLLSTTYLAEIARRLEPIANVAVVRLGDGDIVRHPLVSEMLSVL